MKIKIKFNGYCHKWEIYTRATWLFVWLYDPIRDSYYSIKRWDTFRDAINYAKNVGLITNAEYNSLKAKNEGSV